MCSHLRGPRRRGYRLTIALVYAAGLRIRAVIAGRNKDGKSKKLVHAGPAGRSGDIRHSTCLLLRWSHRCPIEIAVYRLLEYTQCVPLFIFVPIHSIANDTVDLHFERVLL